MPVRSFCRLCDCSCGVAAHVQDGVLQGLDPDDGVPITGNSLCSTATACLADINAPDRVTHPMKRTAEGLVRVSWDDAMSGVAEALRKARGRGEPRSIGLYLGEQLQQSDRGYIRALAAAVALGTPSVFSELSEGAGPRLLAAERALGHPAPLLPDIGRAHYVLALGGEQAVSGWGPLVRGRAHGEWLAHSRQTKGTKLVVAGPRRTDFAADATQHLAIRPGSEPFFLLGMLVATVKGGWHDPQYVRDYTCSWDTLAEALAPWSVDRCASMCGIDAAALSGVALKFARAAMAVAVPDASTFCNAHGSLAAWAWMTLHTVTANTLRPGGLYDHDGVFDIHHVLALLKTDRAPRTRVGRHPLVLMQAPASAFIEDALVPGEGQVTALVCVRGNPARRLPGAARVDEALQGLDTLVCLATHEDETTALADWVLPVVHSWEREDFETVGAVLLPRDAARYTPALLPPAGEARHEADILADLTAAVGASRGPWGWHVGVVGRWLAKADLASWERKLASWVSDADWEDIAAAGGLDEGESDRSIWRVSREDGRIELFPEGTMALLEAVDTTDAESELSLWLRTSMPHATEQDAAPDRASGAWIRLHPDLGFEDGARVRVRTRHGSAEGIALLDERLRPDTVDIPRDAGLRATMLLCASRLDALVGTAERDGLACMVEPVDAPAVG